jgi:hypothetical protein
MYSDAWFIKLRILVNACKSLSTIVTMEMIIIVLKCVIDDFEKIGNSQTYQSLKLIALFYSL